MRVVDPREIKPIVAISSEDAGYSFVEKREHCCETCKYEKGYTCRHPKANEKGFFDIPEDKCWAKKKTAR